MAFLQLRPSRRSSEPVTQTTAVAMPSRRALAQRQSTQAIVDFQSETAEVIGRTQTLATSAVVWVLSVMVVTALFLASVVRLDRVVTSPGELVAVNGTFVVQPLDTSLVKKIRVHEGDVVAKGQVLATLDPTFTTADVSDLQQKIGSLRAEIARLSAERDDKTYIPEVDDSYGALQAQIWERRHSEYASQLKDYDQRIGSSQEQVNKASKDADLLRSRLKIQQDIEQMRTTLEQHETGSRLNALMATDNRLEVARNLVATENQISSSSHDLESLRAQRQVYIDHWRNDIVQNIVTQQNALDSTLEDLSKAQKRSDLIELQAPEDAVVLKISRSVSEGAVAQAAEQLFTLVPLNAPMEAEVQINARDLGFIQPGDHVELKLDAYRYLEHGTVKGTVKTVSSDSFTEDLKDSRATAPFYRARIQLTDVKLRNVPKTFRLIPGMPLQADIVVGTRTIMSYLVGGALQNLDEGMREP